MIVPLHSHRFTPSVCLHQTILHAVPLCVCVCVKLGHLYLYFKICVFLSHVSSLNSFEEHYSHNTSSTHSRFFSFIFYFAKTVFFPPIWIMLAYLHNYPHHRLRIIVLQIWFRTQIPLASLPLLNLTYGRFASPFSGRSTNWAQPWNYKTLCDGVTAPMRRDFSTGPAAVIWLSAQRQTREAMKTEMAFTCSRGRRCLQD